MSKPNSKRIVVSEAQQPLQNPFENLSSDLAKNDSSDAEAKSPAHESSEQLTVSENEKPRKSLKPIKFGRVVLRRETAHRGGKAVIAIDQFEPEISDEKIDALARQLRAECGCGGTVKNRVIEIQGDQAAKICALLEAKGFRVAGVR